MRLQNAVVSYAAYIGGFLSRQPGPALSFPKWHTVAKDRRGSARAGGDNRPGGSLLAVVAVAGRGLAVVSADHAAGHRAVQVGVQAMADRYTSAASCRAVHIMLAGPPKHRPPGFPIAAGFGRRGWRY